MMPTALSTKEKKVYGDWRKPQDIDRVEMAFPASALEYMPKYEEIPDEYRRMQVNNKWHKLFTDSFYLGIKDLKLVPQDDIDPEKAWNTLVAIRGSFASKHEHKSAAFAYLASLWFKDATWEALKPQNP